MTIEQAIRMLEEIREQYGDVPIVLAADRDRTKTSQLDDISPMTFHGAVYAVARPMTDS